MQPGAVGEVGREHGGPRAASVVDGHVLAARGRQPIAVDRVQVEGAAVRAAEVEADPGLGGMEPARRPALALVGTFEGPDVAGELRPGVARALLDRVRHPGRQADEVSGPAVPAADDVAVGPVQPDPVALDAGVDRIWRR